MLLTTGTVTKKKTREKDEWFEIENKKKQNREIICIINPLHFSAYTHHIIEQ